MGNLIGLAAIILLLVFLKGESRHSKERKNATRRCRQCGMVIPYNASICPYCRRKPGTDLGSEFKVETGGALRSMWKWLLALLLLSIIIVVAQELGLV